VSLANTGEPLYLVNRSGNRPSHEGAAAYVNQAVLLCRGAGFRKIRLRGDTDFVQTEHVAVVPPVLQPPAPTPTRARFGAI
jgi:hypothetical protein